MTSENNDLEFDNFEAGLNEAIRRHAPIKSEMFEQTKRLSWIKRQIKKSWKGHVSEIDFKHRKWHW